MKIKNKEFIKTIGVDGKTEKQPLRPYGLGAGDFIVPEDFNQSLPEDIIL